MRSYRIWNSFIQAVWHPEYWVWEMCCTLIEKAEAEIDEDQGKTADSEDEEELSLTYNDFLASTQQMKKMGGMSGILGMLPGMGALGGKGLKISDEQTSEAEKQMARMEAMIYSMTPEERENPDLMNPSRKHRIAKGAGVDISRGEPYGQAVQ